MKLKEIKERAEHYIKYGSSAEDVSEASEELDLVSKDILFLLDYIKEQKKAFEISLGRGIPGNDESQLFEGFVTNVVEMPDRCPDCTMSPTGICSLHYDWD